MKEEEQNTNEQAAGVLSFLAAVVAIIGMIYALTILF